MNGKQAFARVMYSIRFTTAAGMAQHKRTDHMCRMLRDYRWTPKPNIRAERKTMRACNGRPMISILNRRWPDLRAGYRRIKL